MRPQPNRPIQTHPRIHLSTLHSPLLSTLHPPLSTLLPRPLRPLRPAGHEAGTPGWLDQLEVGMTLQKTPDGSFVFLRCKGTGGVNQPAARAQQLGGAFQDVMLADRTAGDVRLAPMKARFLFLAKHALAGTGRIDDHPIKRAGPACGQPPRRFAEHQGVRARPSAPNCGARPRHAHDRCRWRPTGPLRPAERLRA